MAFSWPQSSFLRNLPNDDEDDDDVHDDDDDDHDDGDDDDEIDELYFGNEKGYPGIVYKR